MKIQNINSHHLSNTRKFQNLTTGTLPKYNADKFSFMKRNEKDSSDSRNNYISWYKKRFRPEVMCLKSIFSVGNLTKEELISEHIKQFVRDSIEYNIKIQDCALRFGKEISVMLSLNNKMDNNGYITYDKENIIFSDISEKTGFPRNISAWQNGEYIRLYEIEETSPNLKYTYTMQKDGIKNVYKGINSDIVYSKTSLSDGDQSSNIITFKTKDGYILYSTEENKEYPDSKIEHIIYYSYRNYKEHMFLESDKDKFKLYKYNTNKGSFGAWEYKGLMDSTKAKEMFNLI